MRFHDRQNLDYLHSHLQSAYPEGVFPSFQCFSGADGALLLHYYSSRAGLHAFVAGLVKQVAKQLYQTDVKVAVREVEAGGPDAEREALGVAIESDRERAGERIGLLAVGRLQPVGVVLEREESLRNDALHCKVERRAGASERPGGTTDGRPR